MLRQYILTRFNLRLWKRNKFLLPVSDTKWLEQRFQLFETYCLPSIMAQSQQNFRWIVLFDSETPQIYKDHIKALREKCPQLSPIWVQPHSSWDFARIFMEVVRYDLELLAKKEIYPTKVATTYLDNDDALAKDYLHRVAEESRKIEQRSVITFHYGIQYFEGMKLANRIFYPNNHFQTLVEPINEQQRPITIYMLGSHAGIYKIKPDKALIHEVKTPDRPAWVEVVHQKNIGNDVRPTFDTKLMTKPTLLKELSDVDAPLTKHPHLKFCTLFALRFPFEYVRHMLVRVFESQIAHLMRIPQEREKA